MFDNSIMLIIISQKQTNRRRTFADIFTVILGPNCWRAS